MIDLGNEITKCVLKVYCAVILSEHLKGYFSLRWVLGHLQTARTRTWWPDGHFWKYSECIMIMCGLQPPPNHSSMLLHLLTALQPQSHLRIFIFAVCCTVGILGKVNVEMLGLLSIVVIS